MLQAQGLGLDSAVAVVTSDFHTLRAQRIARKMGHTRARAVAAPTPLYIRYNAWLREYFAMTSSCCCASCDRGCAPFSKSYGLVSG